MKHQKKHVRHSKRGKKFLAGKKELGLNKKDYETFNSLVMKATRRQLDELEAIVGAEIRLSETAISEEFEKDDRKWN
jgi:hypothetical protein